MGGGIKVDIPDYKIYKIDDHPHFVKLQEKLAADGLKDPWLRNHVWKYRCDLTNHWRQPFYKYFMLPGVMRGVMIGLAATGVYAVSDQLFGLSGLIFGKDDHGHGHEHKTEEVATSEH